MGLSVDENPSSERADVALVFPPLWLDLHAAYPAVPYLAGYLAREGYRVAAFDLNRDYLQTLLEDEAFLDRRLRQVVGELEALDAAPELRPGQLGAYLNLLPLVSIARQLGGAGVANLVRAQRALVRETEAEGLFMASGSLNLDAMSRSSRRDVEALRLQLAIRPVLTAATTCVLRGSRLLAREDVDVLETARTLFAEGGDDPALEHYLAFVRAHLVPRLAVHRLIGISVTVPSQLLYALALAREVRRAAPDARIVIGGNLVTHLRSSMAALAWTRGLIDGYVHGEGEVPLAAWIEATRAGRAPAGLPNTIVPGDDAPVEPAVQSPVDATPDFTTIPLTTPPREYFSRCLYLRTSRGCYYSRCKYCTHPLVFGHNYRSISAERLVEIMAELSAAWGTRSFFFTDEALAPHMADTLSRALLAAGAPYQWGAYQRFEQTFVRRELLEPMYHAGCRLLVVGLESVNERVVELMDKGTTKEAAQLLLDTMKRLGMGAILYTLTGYPTETEDEARETYEFVKQNLGRNVESYCHLFWLNVHSASFVEKEQLGIRLAKGARPSLAVVKQFETDVGMSRAQAAALHHELAAGIFDAWKALFAADLGIAWPGADAVYRPSPYLATGALSYSMKDAVAAIRGGRALARRATPAHYIEELSLGRRIEVPVELRDFLACFRAPMTLADAAAAYCAAHGVELATVDADMREGLRMLVEAGFLIPDRRGDQPDRARPPAAPGEQRPVHAQLVDGLANARW